MSDLIGRIKEVADVLSLFGRHYPDRLRRKGTNMVCPFHGDSPDRPSLSYSERDRKLHCHGACDRSWDVLDLYQEIHGCTLGEAKDALARECGIITSSSCPSPKKSKSKKAPPSLEEKWRKLRETPIGADAATYLEEKRCLKGIVAELQKAGEIGYDKAWRQYYNDPETGELKHNVKPAIAFKVADYTREKLFGIQMVPFDGTDKKFSKGSETRDGFFVFGSTGQETRVVTEAVIDALSIHVSCSRLFDLQVISVFSASQVLKIKSLPGPPLILFMDNDFAGTKATIKAVLELRHNVALVNWAMAPGDCKDPNDLLKKGHSKTIERMIRHARKPEDPVATVKELLEQLRSMARNPKEEQEVRHLEDEWRRMAEGKEPEDLPEIKRIKELNESHAVLWVGSKCLIMQEAYDPAFGRKNLQFVSPSDLKNFHIEETYLIENGCGRPKIKDIGTLWFESPLRRKYDGITFDPAQDHPRFYNLYQGLAVKPVPGKWDLFQEHIFSVISNKDPTICQYIFAWLAHLFQHPGGQRPGVSLVLRGDQGTGKGCFVGHIGKIVGQHFMHITSPKQLTGRFNAHLKDALLVFCDEGVWGGDKTAEGTLKAMITEEYKSIEAKGKDLIMVKNFIRLIVASNNDWVIPAGKWERRFCCLDVSPIHMQERAYFAAIHEEMDHGGREAMLHDLLGLDISSFDFGNFPKTNALREQQLRSMSTLEQFWHSRLYSGALLDSEDHWRTDGVLPGEYSPSVITQKLYEAYVLYGQRTGNRYLESDAVFMKELKKLCPSARQSRRTTLKDGRKMVYTFPDLKTCREQFIAKTGMIEAWPEEE